MKNIRNFLIAMLVLMAFGVVMAGDAFYDKPISDGIKSASANYVTLSASANANGGTNVVTLTVKDMAGATYTSNTLVRIWVGDTAQSAPSAVAGEIVIDSAVTVQAVTAKAHYVIGVTNSGVAQITIKDDPGNTNYLHAVVGGGPIRTTPLYFNVP